MIFVRIFTFFVNFRTISSARGIRTAYFIKKIKKFFKKLLTFIHSFVIIIYRKRGNEDADRTRDKRKDK